MMLCGNENGKLEIIMLDCDYDYFSYINLGYVLVNMVICFMCDIFLNENGWLLCLCLISEVELV